MLKAPLQTDCGPSSIRSACQLTGRNAFPGAPRPTMSYSSVLASPLRPASSARPVARRRVEGVRARRHHPRIIKIVADDRGGGRFADIVARVEGHVSEAEGDQRGADLVGWLLECQRAGGDVRLIGCVRACEVVDLLESLGVGRVEDLDFGVEETCRCRRRHVVHREDSALACLDCGVARPAGVVGADHVAVAAAVGDRLCQDGECRVAKHSGPPRLFAGLEHCEALL
mmetsp:Transcript_65229/g.178984  ORF Transcript_65229/g.178984 Transcript_65229/m.178984 type:complete len:228 (-) Transcript_65229:20-703(-)